MGKKKLYLVDNYWWRTSGYVIVDLLAFVFGLLFAVSVEDIEERVIVACLRQMLPSIIYSVLTAILFLAGYVSIYLEKRVNVGYKVIVLMNCSLFICMVYMLLNVFENNRLLFVLPLYGIISLSGVLFYCRLTAEQLECVRYELLWPAIYTIALSAYMGYALMYSCYKGNDDFSIYIPVLLLIVYEYVLFLSDIPKKESKRNYIGIVHLLFVLLLIGFALIYDCCKNAIFFILFCGASMILESIDTIHRKQDLEVRKKYEAGVCLSVCIFIIIAGLLGALMQKISLIYVIVLVVIIEGYSILFYYMQTRKTVTDKLIDAVKMLSFIAGVFLIGIVGLVGINWKSIAEGIISPSDTVIVILGILSTLLCLLFKQMEKMKLSEVREEIQQFIKNIFKTNNYLKLNSIFMYMAVACFIGQGIMGVSIWATEKLDRTRWISILLAILGIWNFILHVWISNLSGEATNEK